MRKIVIFGATSAIATEFAREASLAGDHLLLVGRDEQRLEELRNDMLTRGAKEVYMLAADLADVASHEQLLDQASKVLPDYDTILIAYGTLGDQEGCEKSFDLTLREWQTNFVSQASLVARVANIFEGRDDDERERCSIAVITSVAGDRGRKSNYVYGTAKGALSLFLQGVRNRLADSGVHVLTVKPGFVDTPMTAHIEKGPLFASAEKVGKGIYSALKAKKDVVYIPFFWLGIMAVIKGIPEKIFKRTSI